MHHILFLFSAQRFPNFSERGPKSTTVFDSWKQKWFQNIEIQQGLDDTISVLLKFRNSATNHIMCSVTSFNNPQDFSVLLWNTQNIKKHKHPSPQTTKTISVEGSEFDWF